MPKQERRLKYQLSPNDAISQTAAHGGTLDIGAYVRVDGTRKMTADWDAGGYEIECDVFDADTAFYYGGAHVLSAPGDENLLGGELAGDSLTTGAHCVYLGYGSGETTEDDDSNVGVGAYTLNAADGAAGNVAVGAYAMETATTASYCVAIGLGSLDLLEDGDLNTAVGSETLEYLVDGEENAVFGYLSGQGCTGSESENTYIGSRTGVNSIGASGCVSLGFSAGGNNTTSNRLYIANSNTTTPLIYGEFDTPYAEIHGDLGIHTAYGLKHDDGVTDGYVLRANGTRYIPGQLSFSDLSGSLSSAMAYGGMYQNATSFTVTLTTQNTWYELDHATTNISAGELNFVTFPDDHYLLVANAGVYKVDWSCTVQVSVANQGLEFGVMVNGTIQSPGQARMMMLNATRNLNISGTAFLDLSANDQISLGARNITSGARVITVSFLNVTVAGVGGTGDIGAHVYNSGAQSVTTATWTALTADSELYDTDTIHSTVANTSRLTATTAGKYWIWASVQFAANATGDRAASFDLNGGGTYHGQQRVGAFASSNCEVTPGVELDLAANDYVECRCRHSRGVNLNVTLSSFGMRKRA